MRSTNFTTYLDEGVPNATTETLSTLRATHDQLVSAFATCNFPYDKPYRTQVELSRFGHGHHLPLPYKLWMPQTATTCKLL